MKDRNRRLFLRAALSGMSLVAGGAIISTLFKSTFKRKTTLGLIVDLEKIKTGTQSSIIHEETAYYIYRRLPEEVKVARNEKFNELFVHLIDRSANNPNISSNENATEQNRTINKNSEFIMVSAYCTYNKCIVKHSNRATSKWTCACCGSQYDKAGRVIRGPARRNLTIPKYISLGDNNIQLLPANYILHH